MKPRSCWQSVGERGPSYVRSSVCIASMNPGSKERVLVEPLLFPPSLASGPGK